jgi:cyclic nucleotide-binding protein
MAGGVIVAAAALAQPYLCKREAVVHSHRMIKDTTLNELGAMLTRRATHGDEGRKVKLTVLSERGKEAIVAIFGSGDFCGEACLAGQPLRIATAVAIEDSKPCGWRKRR